MSLLFDFLPLVVFFIAFKLFNIYVATATAVIISLLQIALYWFKHRRIDLLLLISSGLVIVLGTITLLLHDKIFIKWKPTAISWAFALAFMASHYFGKKPLIQYALESVVQRLEDKLELPKQVWCKLNLMWVIFYLVLGGINIYVIYHFDDTVWLYFKVFGLLGLTLVFIVLQSLYLSRFMTELKENSQP